MEEIKAVFGADTSAFTRGLQRMSNGLKSFAEKSEGWKKQFQKFDLGDVGKLFGLGAIVKGFSSALTNAQKLRDEAVKLGTDLSPAVQRTAELADNLDTLKSNISELGGEAIGLIQAGVDRAVAGVSAAFGMGSYDENMKAIEDGRKRDLEEKRRNAEKKKADDTAKKDAEELNRLREKRAQLEKDAEYESKDLVGKMDSLQSEDAQLSSRLRLVKSEKEREELLVQQLEVQKKIGALEDQINQKREEASKKIADAKQKEADAQKKTDDEQQKKLQELEELEYDRAQARMSDEEKLRDIIKRGRDAQKRVEENPDDIDAKIGREKIRKEYEDHIRRTKDQKGEKAYDIDSAIEGMKGADGKIRNKDGRIISEETRRKSLEHSLRNAKLSDDKRGLIGKDKQQKTPKTEAEYLKEIVESLKAKEIK